MTLASVPPPEEGSEQLSFLVGSSAAAPSAASLKLSGTIALAGELYQDHSFTVRVVDAEGKVVAEGDGMCVDVGFKRHPKTKSHPSFVERKHVIRLGDDEE